MNIFRVPFLMERMIPTEMTGSLNTAYFEGYSEVRTLISPFRSVLVLIGYRSLTTSPVKEHMQWLTLTTLDDSKSPLLVILKDFRDTYSRPSYGTPISSTSDFQTFWSTLASQFKSNDKVIFDTSKYIYFFYISNINLADTLRQRIPRHG
jgi:endoglucanase